MKSTAAPSPRKNSLRNLIEEATGAPVSDLAMIENIMRDDIFHSTLDWQTSEQLVGAARQAFALLNANRELYEFLQTSALATFNEMRAAEASR
jgi:hypothetical protein